MTYKTEREVVKVTKEVVEFHNYAEYLLTVELHKVEEELKEFNPDNLGTYQEYVEVKDRATQLENAIIAVKDANDLPF
jgi:hypothetical protein